MISTQHDSPDRLDAARLDDDQRGLAELDDRIVAVAAPPGSGKTTALAALMAQRIERGTDPDRIVMLTFTRRAAWRFQNALRESMRCETIHERIVPRAERFGRPLNAPTPLWIGTTHEIGSRILHHHVELLGRRAGMRTIGADEMHQRMYQALNDANALPEGEHEAHRMTLKCLQALEQIKHRGEDPTGPTRQRGLKVGWKDAHIAYEHQLGADNALDLPDLLGRVWRLFRQRRGVALAWSTRFDQVLVDEMQDTDPIVIALLRILGRNAQIVVAGDPDQSIYGWRNAIGTFRSLARLDSTHGRVRTHTLRHDYRLPVPIQSAAGRLRAAMANPGPSPSGARRQGFGEPCWIGVDADEDPIRLLAQSLEAVLAGPAAQPREANGDDADDKRRSDAGDCVVLARTRQGCLEIAQGLTRAGWAVWLGQRSRPSAAVDTLVAWAAAAARPDDDGAIARALGAWPVHCVPGRIDAMRRQARARAMTLWGRIEQAEFDGARPAETLQIDPNTLATLRHCILLARDGEDHAVMRLIEKTWELARKAAQDGDQALQEWESTAGLAQTLREDGAPLEVMVQHLRQHYEDDLEDSPTGERRVGVRTMHAVKGLEFRHVWAMGWTENDFPSQWDRDPQRQEERRVAFTTLTRAQRTFVAFVEASTSAGHSRAPSRFLSEAGIEQRARRQ